MKNLTQAPATKVVNSKFKIYTLTETKVKVGEHLFPEENLSELHSATFSFHCDNEDSYRQNFQQALKEQIDLAQSKVNVFLDQQGADCLHKNIYFCSQACYPNSTVSLEYNSNLNPNVIHETKYGMLINKIDFNP